MTAPVAAQTHIIQAAWPGEAIQVVTGSVVKLDAFEGLLVHAGMDPLDQLPTRTGHWTGRARRACWRCCSTSRFR